NCDLSIPAYVSRTVVLPAPGRPPAITACLSLGTSVEREYRSSTIVLCSTVRPLDQRSPSGSLVCTLWVARPKARASSRRSRTSSACFAHAVSRGLGVNDLESGVGGPGVVSWSGRGSSWGRGSGGGGLRVPSSRNGDDGWPRGRSSRRSWR